MCALFCSFLFTVCHALFEALILSMPALFCSFLLTVCSALYEALLLSMHALFCSFLSAPHSLKLSYFPCMPFSAYSLPPHFLKLPFVSCNAYFIISCLLSVHWFLRLLLMLFCNLFCCNLAVVCSGVSEALLIGLRGLSCFIQPSLVSGRSSNSGCSASFTFHHILFCRGWFSFRPKRMPT